MALDRDRPYVQFNFIVTWSGDSQGTAVGGFSEVSGLGSEVTVSEYRGGSEKFDKTLKVPATHKLGDVTLKRGIVSSKDLFAWVKRALDGTADPRQVTITLVDEARRAVATWSLRNARPTKWTGPTLAAKGSGEVAIEELHLTYEGIERKQG